MTTPETYMSLLSTWNIAWKHFETRAWRKAHLQPAQGAVTAATGATGATGATVRPSLCGNEVAAASYFYSSCFLSSFLLTLPQVSLRLVLCACSSPFSYYFYSSAPSYCLQVSSSFFTSNFSSFSVLLFSLFPYSLFFTFVSLCLFTSFYFLFLHLFCFIHPSHSQYYSASSYS